MRAIDAIRTALKFSDMAVKHLESMSDTPLLRPGAWGGNHAMWIAGHLTVVEGRLIGINPYGQPGVEAYKKNMNAILRGKN